MGQDVLRIMCPNLKCRVVLGVPTAARGKLIRCRSCGASIKVPLSKGSDHTHAAATTSAAAQPDNAERPAA